MDQPDRQPEYAQAIAKIRAEVPKLADMPPVVRGKAKVKSKK